MKLNLKTHIAKFARSEDGLALTEYLILLGLLAGAVIVAVTAFGGGLGTSWNSWADWLGLNTGTTT